MGMKRNGEKFVRLHGSTDMRVESRARVEDGSRMSWVWPTLNRDIIISSWRDVRFEEDHGVRVFLIERSSVR